MLTRRLSREKRELGAIAKPVSRATGISVDELRSGSRRRDVVDAKKRFLRAALAEGRRFTEVASWLGITVSALSRYERKNTSHKSKPDTQKSLVGLVR